VLCYHQLRNWTGGDSQYNRINLICPPKYFRAHLDALAQDGWTTINTRADEFVSEPRVRMSSCRQVLGICLCRALQQALTTRPGER
jgi:hypothetical protein